MDKLGLGWIGLLGVTCICWVLTHFTCCAKWNPQSNSQALLGTASDKLSMPPGTTPKRFMQARVHNILSTQSPDCTSRLLPMPIWSSSSCCGGGIGAGRVALYARRHGRCIWGWLLWASPLSCPSAPPCTPLLTSPCSPQHHPQDVHLL